MNKLFKAKLTIPSKTFLIGEYAVLGNDPAPAIIINTNPTFDVFASINDQPVMTGINPNSPSYQEMIDCGLTISFQDPHMQRGGFGGSGAEKIAAHILSKLKSKPAEFTKPDPFHTLKQLKLNTHESGCDVLAQLTGYTAIIDKKNSSAEAYNWHFNDIGFAIVRTGNKVETHEHLTSLQERELEPLKLISQRCVHAFKMRDTYAFIHCINAYNETLSALGLTHSLTTKLIQALNSSDAFLAIKGCGALGADTVLTIYDKDNKNMILDYFRDRHLELVATDENLTELKWELKDVES